MNMADAYARVSRSLGVVITSTGTAAGNAAGSQVEALTAGSPVLHITSQIDRPFMDRDRAAIHDVPRQADMLRAISKAYFRVWEGRTAVGMVEAAARAALTAPRGPVSLEIPIDVQREKVPRPSHVGIGTDRAASGGSDAARRAGRARPPRPASDAVARRRRARGGRGGARSRRARFRGGDQHQRPRGGAGDAPAYARRLQHDAGGAGDLRPRRSHDRGRLAAARQRDPQQHHARCRSRSSRSMPTPPRRRATIPSISSSMPMPRCRARGASASACPSSSTSMRNFSTMSPSRARNPKAKLAAALGPYRVVADALQGAGVGGPASVRARRHALEQHVRQPLCAPRGARISACTRSAAASGRASPWRSARRSPARRRRPSRSSATAAPWSISASSRPWPRPRRTSFSS